MDMLAASGLEGWLRPPEPSGRAAGAQGVGRAPTVPPPHGFWLPDLDAPDQHESNADWEINYGKAAAKEPCA